MRYRYMIVSALLLWATPLQAQAPTPLEEARALFARGDTAFNEARWIDCAHLFERSFTIAFRPELLYNVGLCYQRAAGALPDEQAAPLLGRAVAAFRRYLREVPAATNAERVQTAVADIQARLDSMDPAVSPVTEVTAPPVREVAPVVPEPDSVVVGDPIPTPAPVTVARNDYTLTIVTGALTLVSTALAIGLGLHAQSLYSDLSSTCGQTPAGCNEARISEVGSYSLATNLLWVVSGLALVGTSISFAIEFTATDTRPSLVALTVGRTF
jgi:hypothetical protein